MQWRETRKLKQWSLACNSPKTGNKAVGFLHKRQASANGKTREKKNVRLEPRAMFMLSVDAMGRRLWKRSVRWDVGRGEVVGAGDAMEPAEDLRVVSTKIISTQLRQQSDMELTTLRTIPPIHNRMPPLLPPHRIAQTARKHI